VILPKGTIVNILNISVHRDGKNYEEADSFKPERFLPENRHKIKPYTYLPFGAGPRNCVAMRFALLEAKLLIARMVLEVKFERTEKTSVPPKFGLMSELKGNLFLGIKYRKNDKN
jgi:cytochrome P450